MGGILGKQCKSPRCAQIVTGTGRFCEVHADQDVPWQGAKRTRLRFYSGARWQLIRKLKLAKNPICEICQRKLAVQVHHLEKARESIERRYDLDNLQSVCLVCHARETQKETRETILKAKNG